MLNRHASPIAITVAHHLIPSSPNTFATRTTHRMQLISSPPSTVAISTSGSAARLRVAGGPESSAESSEAASMSSSSAASSDEAIKGAERRRSDVHVTKDSDRIDSDIMIASAGHNIHAAIHIAQCADHESAERHTNPWRRRGRQSSLGPIQSDVTRAPRRPSHRACPFFMRLDEHNCRSLAIERTRFMDTVVSKPMMMPWPI